MEPSSFERVAALESYRSDIAALSGVTRDKAVEAVEIVERLLRSSGSVEVDGRTYDLVPNSTGPRNRRQETAHASLRGFESVSTVDEATLQRFMADLPRIIATAISNLQEDLRSYETALDNSPLKSKATAEQVAHKLMTTGLLSRSDDTIATLSDLAGVNEVSASQLNDAANVAEVLRHAIGTHQKLVLAEAATLADNLYGALCEESEIDVPGLGALAVQEFSVLATPSRLRTFGFYVKRVSIAALLCDPYFQKLKNSRPQEMAALGRALAIDSKPVSTIHVDPDLERRLLKPLPCVSAQTARNFLMHWEDVLKVTEQHMSKRVAQYQHSLEIASSVGV